MKLIYKILAAIVGFCFSILLFIVGKKTFSNIRREKKVKKVIRKKKTLAKVEKEEVKDKEDGDTSKKEAIIMEAKKLRKGLDAKIQELTVTKKPKNKNRKKRG